MILYVRFALWVKKKIELAISNLKAETKVDIIWRSFQLDPEFPMDSSISTNDYLVQRKGYPQAQVAKMTANLVTQGKEYGIDFRFDKAHSFNTFNSHRLIHWANTFGKSNELKEAFMLSYFTDGLNLSISNNLMVVVEKVGLNVAEARQVLNSDKYTTETKADILLAKKLRIGGVPYFIINGESAISGAQRVEVFQNSLAAALKKLPTTDNVNQQGICTPKGVCK